MKLKVVSLIACLLLAVPAWAGSLETLRSNSRGAREQVTALRAEQLKYRSELSALSARIENLKLASKGKLLRGGELDTALKRSQELSGTLAELAGQVSSREGTLEAANLALLDGLSEEMTRLRTEFERQTDRASRRKLIEDMRQLRTERDALRQTLPASKIPTLDGVRPTDNPEELLEQADLLRDNEEKLRRELRSLEARITERRDETELDRRVQRFMGEESMFDDQDRRLRVQRTITIPVTPTTQPSDTTHSGLAPSAFAETAGTPTGRGQDVGLQSDKSPSERAYDAPQVPTVRVTTGSDARVQVGGGQTVSSQDNDLMSLEKERARLEGLAKQLQMKAQELEQRAASLK